jgi:transposase-like protein
MKHKFKFVTFKFSVNHYKCKNCGKTFVAISPKDYSEQVEFANKTKCKKSK